MPDIIKPTGDYFWQCGECGVQSPEGSGLSTEYDAQRSLWAHYDEEHELLCERCGYPDSGEWGGLFPLTVEVGASHEEGWEKWQQFMCADCWDEMRDELEKFVYEVWGIDKKKRFGGWSFHAEWEERENSRYRL